MRYRITMHSSVGWPNAHWWWTLRSAGNGATLATSETYTTRRKALATATKLAQALNITVEDRTI